MNPLEIKTASDDFFVGYKFGCEKATNRERQYLLKLLELARLKTGWDLEAEIDQVIQELKGQTK